MPGQFKPVQWNQGYSYSKVSTFETSPVQVTVCDDPRTEASKQAESPTIVNPYIPSVLLCSSGFSFFGCVTDSFVFQLAKIGRLCVNFGLSPVLLFIDD